MQNQIPSKPSLLLRIICGVLLNFDGLSSLLLSLFSIVFIGLGDPTVDGIGLKARSLQIASIVALILLAYFIFCNVTLAFWADGRRKWDLILAGLSILHILGFSSLYIAMPADFFAFTFYLSLGVNLVILALVFLGKKKRTNLEITTTA